MRPQTVGRGGRHSAPYVFHGQPRLNSAGGEQVEANYLLLPGARPRVSACIGLGRLGSGGGVGGAVCAISQFYAVDAMAMIQGITSMVSRPLAIWKETARSPRGSSTL